MSRMPDDRNGRLGRDASESEDDRTEQDIDGPRDELEPGEVIEAEVGRLVRHPRAETARLKQVAADGEHGSSPFIEIGSKPEPPTASSKSSLDLADVAHRTGCEDWP
jgi:hypothetical protein